MDPYLSPFKDVLRRRFSKALEWVRTLDETEGGVEKFSRVGGLLPPTWNALTGTLQGAATYGFNVDDQNNITYREWAPNAKQAFLVGDFSASHPTPYRNGAN